MVEYLEIKKILDLNMEYRETLFSRGYMITSEELTNLDVYPFYDNWNKHYFGKMKNSKNINIYTHFQQDYTSLEIDDTFISIIGHAYDPFEMVHDEKNILKKCLDSYNKGEIHFFDYINNLTGIFLIIVNRDSKLLAVQDCSGMKSCYFGEVEDNIYITSHPQLIGDIKKLDRLKLISKLTKTKTYNIGNKYLPGNMSPFGELKRLGGNTFLEFMSSFKVVRFFPIIENEVITDPVEIETTIRDISRIIHNNILLSSKKWKSPAISLSGGTDSKTTLACANGNYGKFKYFSFICKPQEKVDATAAKNICNKLNLKHTIYDIPNNNEEIKDFDLLKKIIDHNTSYFKNTSDHEIRKMIYLYRVSDFDIELKSWASETVRVFLDRKYKLDMPKRLNERHFSIFQTRYLLSPYLLRWSDNVYYHFMKEIGLDKGIFNYEHADLYYWEVRMGAWGASVVNSLDFCHNTTMPINNRRLLMMFLSLPRELRKSDEIHSRIIKLNNSEIYETNIEVKNLYFHSYRTTIEKVYFRFRTLLYISKSKRNRGKLN